MQTVVPCLCENGGLVAGRANKRGLAVILPGANPRSGGFFPIHSPANIRGQNVKSHRTLFVGKTFRISIFFLKKDFDFNAAVRLLIIVLL